MANTAVCILLVVIGVATGIQVQHDQKQLSEVEKTNSTQAVYPDWKCKELVPMEDFDLKTYAARPWYSIMQLAQEYQPPSALNCVKAQYIEKEEMSLVSRFMTNALACLWGWDIFVSNQAWDLAGRGQEDTLGFLCGSQVKGSKLKVAPCFLPQAAGGDYWVVAQDEMLGWAVVAGGQPDLPTVNGKCAYKKKKSSLGASVGNAAFFGGASDQQFGNKGMWLFSRTPFPTANVIATARAAAETAGLDTSMMIPVNHAGCTYGVPYKM